MKEHIKNLVIEFKEDFNQLVEDGKFELAFELICTFQMLAKQNPITSEMIEKYEIDFAKMMNDMEQIRNRK